VRLASDPCCGIAPATPAGANTHPSTSVPDRREHREAIARPVGRCRHASPTQWGFGVSAIEAFRPSSMAAFGRATTRSSFVFRRSASPSLSCITEMAPCRRCSRRVSPIDSSHASFRWQLPARSSHPLRQARRSGLIHRRQVARYGTHCGDGSTSHAIAASTVEKTSTSPGRIASCSNTYIRDMAYTNGDVATMASRVAA
jgi:hypothetical protein